MDIRTYLFDPLAGLSFTMEITCAEPGILAGIERAARRAAELGCSVEFSASDGMRVQPGQCVLRAGGGAEEVARAEEELLACVGKPSGVATAAARFLACAAGRARIVCGAWKKVAPEVRGALREAIAVGGAGMRLVDEPFVYLDKNYVRMFGGVAKAVRRARGCEGRVVAVQLRGEDGGLKEEARNAFEAGAGVLMVDTGQPSGLRAVHEAAVAGGFRGRVRLAFGGSAACERLEEIIAAGADIVDVGRAILDAPLLDFRLDVTGRSALA